MSASHQSQTRPLPAAQRSIMSKLHKKNKTKQKCNQIVLVGRGQDGEAVINWWTWTLNRKDKSLAFSFLPLKDFLWHHMKQAVTAVMWGSKLWEQSDAAVTSPAAEASKKEIKTTKQTPKPAELKTLIAAQLAPSSPQSWLLSQSAGASQWISSTGGNFQHVWLADGLLLSNYGSLMPAWTWVAVFVQWFAAVLNALLPQLLWAELSSLFFSLPRGFCNTSEPEVRSLSTSPSRM